MQSATTATAAEAAPEAAAAAMALSSPPGATPAIFATVGRNSEDEDNYAQIPVDLEPAYTPQDEQRDLASLTIADIVRVQSDVTGITLGMSDLSMDQAATAAATAAACTVESMVGALYLLDVEIAKLPAAQTEVYRRALEDYPHLVTVERRMQFLECEGYDAALAARRLAKHWKMRMELFGADRCFLPMTMDGAMKGEVEMMVERRIEQILPVTDTAGRAILYEDASRRNLAEYSMEQEARGVWYLLETLTEDPEVRRRGVVIIVNAAAMQREHYSRKMTLLTEVEYSVVPIRMRAVHICHPNPVVYYIIVPVIKRFLPKDVRLRIKLYHGSTASVLQELEGHSLSKDRVPADLGGALIVNMTKWALDRLALETFRADPTASAHIHGPAAKRPRSEGSPEKLHELTHQNVASAALGADTNTSRPIGESNANSKTIKREEKGRKSNTGGRPRARSRGRGRESDPRMTKAVEIRLSDPGVSPIDALLAGGFVFGDGPLTNGMVDENGVTLSQRKNNLCRRIRRLKEREKKAGAARQSKEGEDDAIYEQDVAAAFSDQDIETTSTNTNLKDDLGVTDSADASDDDSFCDAINELPGIVGLEDMLPAIIEAQSSGLMISSPPP